MKMKFVINYKRNTYKHTQFTEYSQGTQLGNG